MHLRHVVTFAALFVVGLSATQVFGVNILETGYVRVVSIPFPDAGIPEYPPGVFVGPGNALTIHASSTPVRLWFDIEVGGWAPLLLQTMQVGVDATGMDNGVGAPIGPPDAVPCSSDAFCASLFGSGSLCPSSPYAAHECQHLFQNTDKLRLPPDTIIGANQINLKVGWTLAPGRDPIPDDGQPRVVATLVVDVPEGAHGVYSIGVLPMNQDSFMVTPEGRMYEFASIQPARIVVGDRCCRGEWGCGPSTADDCLFGINPGVIVPECLGDCNNNGWDDACDFEQDCDGNGVPDDCDIANGTPDCDWNGVPDVCDLADGTVSDCDGNGVPDRCDVGGGAPDCNFNGVPDYCDLAEGDCDGSGVIDICEDAGITDCNGNGASDACELNRYPGMDCNGNGVIDSCDITEGSSLDANGNCIPDECDQNPAPLPATGIVPGSRFLSFVPSNGGCQAGYRVELVSLAPPSFAEYQGEWHWVQQSSLYWEDAGHTLMHETASLACDPDVRAWDRVGPIHVSGAAIVPESTYEIRRYDHTCGRLEDPACYSAPLTITTPVWGDCMPPFANDPGADPQPNFVDISGVVSKFLGAENPPRIAAELEPAIIDLSLSVDFRDIAACVSSFLGAPYSLDPPGHCPGG